MQPTPETLAELEEAERLRAYRIHWLESRVPPVFEKPQPDYLRPFLDLPAVRLVRETIRQWKDTRKEPGAKPNPLLIGICGSPGTGKSTVGVELLRMAAQNWGTVRYVTLERMSRIIESRQETWEDLDIEWLRPQMLVIDDVFNPELPSHKRAFTSLVLEREAFLKWTILVATCDPKEFGNILGGQVVDRFSAPALTLVGQSHRTYA